MFLSHIEPDHAVIGRQRLEATRLQRLGCQRHDGGIIVDD